MQLKSEIEDLRKEIIGSSEEVEESQELKKLRSENARLNYQKSHLQRVRVILLTLLYYNRLLCVYVYNFSLMFTSIMY